MRSNHLKQTGTFALSTFAVALILLVPGMALPVTVEAAAVKIQDSRGLRVQLQQSRPKASSRRKIGTTKPRTRKMKRQTRTSGNLVDILVKRTGSFGKKTFHHSQTLVVTKRDATSMSNNVCTFKLGYGTHATGDTGSKFLNKVKLFTSRVGSPIENYLHPRIRQQMTVLRFSNIKLKPVRQNPGEPGLPTNFRISIGANLAINGRRYVKESNYNNNVVKFKVILNGDCRPRRIIKPGDQDRGPIHPN